MQLHNWQQSRNSKFVTHAFSGVKWHDGSQTLKNFVEDKYTTDKLHANNALANISVALDLIYKHTLVKD